MHLTYELINQADWFNNFWIDHQSSLYFWRLLGVHCSCTCYEWCLSHSIIHRYYYPYIAFWLHNLKLLSTANWDFLGWESGLIFFFFFFEIGRNCVSIIVTIISNINVLQRLFALDICVNKKAPPTPSVHRVLNPTSKTSTPSFLPRPLLSANPLKPPFEVFYPQCIGFSCTPLKIKFFSELPKY